jgi:hypothetical protein
MTGCECNYKPFFINVNVNYWIIIKIIITKTIFIIPVYLIN